MEWLIKIEGEKPKKIKGNKAYYGDDWVVFYKTSYKFQWRCFLWWKWKVAYESTKRILTLNAKYVRKVERID